MRVFLAGTNIIKNHPNELKKCKYILESFYSYREWQQVYMRSADMFIMDSGAFTFMRGKQEPRWGEYIEKYAECIVRTKCKYFMELDIDNVVGYPKVIEYRKMLERLVGARCIPVWHKARGINQYRNMLEEYEYIAIGGLVTKEIKPTEYKYLPALIAEAHEKNVKIHGLGFTKTVNYPDLKWDSVDSTTWNVGGKFGEICNFRDGKMERVQMKGHLCVKQKELMLHNYTEWLKFQKYAEVHL